MIRIVQLSFQRRAASLQHAHEIVAETQALVKAVQERSGKLVLFIRDIHLAYRFDLEEQLCALAYGVDGFVIGEGTKSGVDDLLEQDQSLQQHYVRVAVDEPGQGLCQGLLAFAGAGTLLSGLVESLDLFVRLFGQHA